MLSNVKILSKIQDRLRGQPEKCISTVDTLTAELEGARLLAIGTNKPAAAARDHYSDGEAA